MRSVAPQRTARRRRRRWKLTYRSGEPQRRSLVPPVERQARVGHQLVGGELRRLLSRQDRGDDVGGEEGQPHDARRIRGGDIFLAGDVLRGWDCRPRTIVRRSSGLGPAAGSGSCRPGRHPPGHRRSNFISFPVRFNRAGMLSLTRSSSPLSMSASRLRIPRQPRRRRPRSAAFWPIAPSRRQAQFDRRGLAL